MFSRRILFYRPIIHLLNTELKHLDLKHVVRRSHVVSYRVAPPPHSKATLIGAELVGAAMWWWILWHLWHEHEHITGEFSYPDTKAWSNKELGVPPEN